MHWQATRLAVVQIGIAKAQFEQLQGADLPVAVIVRLGQQLVRQQAPVLPKKLSSVALM